MIHHSIGASRRVARTIAAAGGLLWPIIAGPLPAGAGGIAPGLEPPLRGSYCEGSDQDLASARTGCARISGYIAAGARFGSDEQIGGRPNVFAPLDDPGIAGGDIAGFESRRGQSFLPPAASGDEIR